MFTGGVAGGGNVGGGKLGGAVEHDGSIEEASAGTVHEVACVLVFQ